MVLSRIACVRACVCMIQLQDKTNKKRTKQEYIPTSCFLSSDARPYKERKSRDSDMNLTHIQASYTNTFHFRFACHTFRTIVYIADTRCAVYVRVCCVCSSLVSRNLNISRFQIDHFFYSFAFFVAHSLAPLTSSLASFSLFVCHFTQIAT